MRHTSIHISKSALQHNLQRVKQLAPQAQVVCMVKANAYGIGVANAVSAFTQADAFGVACLEEALEIRELGYQQPITLIEGIFSADEMTTVIANNLEVIVHHQPQLDWLLTAKDQYIAKGLKVWVKLNSGMNRLGFKISEIIDVISQLKENGFTCVLTMHFANADADHPLNDQQIQQFLTVKEACSPILASCCNSAAITKWPHLHFDFVRPGIMLYGASPFADQSAKDLNLKAVMTLNAEIIALNQIQAGEQVGYGSTFIATKNMSLAIVSIGYGDGYPRAYLEQNYVAIRDKLAPIVGRVAMDMIAIDVSEFEPLPLGSKVELWGKHRTVDDVATANGTIGYELLCRVTARPQRILED